MSPAAPNPFSYRAKIDRLWRRSDDGNPGYIRVKALDTLVRELFAPNPRAQLNYQTYLATDPFDVARHKLRDLYDHADPIQTSFCPPRPLGEGWGEGPSASLEDEPLEEDDDPL